jgi:two-component system, chemotaxis family, sensor kinase CheA
MENLQHVFIEEAHELLADLEESLLSFEKDLNNMESVKGIFRVMHTLKGSSAMFGYSAVNAFTHQLESIYDAIREERIKASPETLELTLASVDHLRQLIDDPMVQHAELATRHEHLLGRIAQEANSLLHEPLRVASKPAISASGTYYISFAAGAELLKNGANPLYLIDDLLQCGHGVVLSSINDLPSLDVIDPSRCYLSFEVILESSQTENELREVFMFVDGQATIFIKKIGDTFLLSAEVKALLTTADPVAFPLGVHKVESLLLANDLTNRLTKGILAKDEVKPISVQNSTAKSTNGSIRVSGEKLDELMNLISELVTTQARLSMFVNGLEFAELTGITENMEKITRRLRDNAFSICLIPIDTLITRFQRLVRDLAKEVKKEISFVTEGTETELDKSVIENLSDPLLHLIRNCIDHGIESPEERIRKGKPRTGILHLKTYTAGTNIVIELKDDGTGIDCERVKAKAVEKGLIPAHSELTKTEIYNLLFLPGFSTAVAVSDISGRGVGMDVVRRAIEELQGEVEIESEENKGTKFTIRLPLTLSIIDGLLVTVEDNTYVLPVQAVDKCYEVPAALLLNDKQHIALDGERVPVFHLRSIFHGSSQGPSISQIIKVTFNNQPVGISVDTILGEHQVVLKPLGQLYKGHEEFSGATILGNGTVALVFDVNKLIKKVIETTTKPTSYANNNQHEPFLSNL